MSSAASVTASEAVLAYPGAEPTIANLSVELKAGELVILLGPNGGGKTTFLRALTGELAPRSGSFEVEGRVAYLPQHDRSRTDFPVSALDVVLMGTIGGRPLWRRAGRTDRARALAALSQVGLEPLADRTYGELSGGQRRRVLLARTIVGGAPVIALDEPLAGVDPQSALVIRQTLEALRDEGRLVIEASHDIELARSADRVVCLAGRMVAAGAPSDALTDEVLRETYAGELTVIGEIDGRPVLATAECCDHSHEAIG